MKQNKLLYAIYNNDGTGFFLYLVPKEKRNKVNDLYLLKLRSNRKNNDFNLYLKEWEAIGLAVTLGAGIFNKRRDEIMNKKTIEQLLYKHPKPQHRSHTRSV